MKIHNSALLHLPFSPTPSHWEGWRGPGELAQSQERRAASMAARRFDQVTPD